jgi:NCS1 family nucleobase:cation symporter-1
LNLAQFYDADGAFRGVNWAGMAAVAVGAVVALSFSAVSWYASLLPAGLTYYFLMKHWAPCRRFLDGQESATATLPASVNEARTARP